MVSSGPEAVLEQLLSSLPLSPEMAELVREVFQLVMREIRNLDMAGSYRGVPQTTVKQNIERLNKVIAFFELAEDEREEFLNVFPDWLPKRKKCLEKLREIAESIGESRKMFSKAQIVGGSAGIIGGICIICSILCPPAIPVLVPASLAVGGGLVVGVSGAAQVVSSCAEVGVLHRLIKEAKEVCEDDARDFEPMVGWFKHTAELEGALADLFDVDFLYIISRDLKDFFGSCKVDFSPELRTALRQCIERILSHPGFRLSTNPSIQAASLSVLLAVFLAYRRNRQLFNFFIFTQRLGLGVVASVDVGVHVGRLIASSAVESVAEEAVELTPLAVGKKMAVGGKVTVGVFTGLGIALDATNVVLNSIDLVGGLESDEQRKINDVADKLKDECDLIKKVYDKFSTYRSITVAKHDLSLIRNIFLCFTVACCFYIMMMMYLGETNPILQFGLLIGVIAMNYFFYMTANIYETVLNIPPQL